MTVYESTSDYDRNDEHATLTADAVLFAPDADGALHVLLVLRRYEPHAGRWAIPGGKLNQGETDYDAAMRECREETGIQPPPLTEVTTYRAPMRDVRGRFVSFTWTALLDSMPTPSGGDDAERAEWFPVAELPALAFDHAEIVADALDIIRPALNSGTDLSADSDEVRELYGERAHLVAALAALFPSRIACNDPVEPELPVIYIHTKAGQISYHLNPAHLHLFGHVPAVDGESSIFTAWDGHTKADALARLRRLAELEASDRAEVAR